MAASVNNGVSSSFLQRICKQSLPTLETAAEDNETSSRTRWSSCILHGLTTVIKYALRTQLVDLIGDYIYFAPSQRGRRYSQQTCSGVHVRVRSPAAKPYSIPNRSGWVWSMVITGAYDFGNPNAPEILPYYTADGQTVYAKLRQDRRANTTAVSGVTWERYNSRSQSLPASVTSIPDGGVVFLLARMAFWNDYHPKLAQVKFDTKKDCGQRLLARVCTLATFLQ
ncbi:hypothetical protein OS493_039653, partial [Desmophyllum pertusum]